MSWSWDRPRPRRCSPIELLVVIDILAVLMALAIPAAQKVREAAARAESHDRIEHLPPVARDGLELPPLDASSPIDAGSAAPSCRGVVPYFYPPEPERQGPGPRPTAAHWQLPVRQVRNAGR
jgi:hypothetical protein